MTKHARDLLHHAEAKGNSELKKIAQKAFNVSSKMLKVRDTKRYSDIRDLEHHTEDLLTALRTERKKLTDDDCPTCGDFEKRLDDYEKPLNREYPQLSNSVQTEEIHMTTMQNLIGSFAGKGISEVTSRYVTGASFGIQNKTLLNLGIGLGIDLLALRDVKKSKKILPKKAGVSLVSAANFLIADEIGDLVAGYIPAVAVARVAPIRVAPSVSVATGGVPQFSNGKHIFVD